MTTVLKLGGELLEDGAAVQSAAAAIVRLASNGALIVVHGGGRAIDAELRARGLEPRFVDGLRITDAPALDAVVSVLAGRNNTALVAAIGAAGARAVGLTGADAFIGRSRRAGVIVNSSTWRSPGGWTIQENPATIWHRARSTVFSSRPV